MLRPMTLPMAATVFAALGLPAFAGPIAPSALTIDVPLGSNNPGSIGTGVTPDPSLVYVDDIYIHALTFGSTVFQGNDVNLRGAIDLEVLSGRGNVNVEWGDSDTNSDGDPTGMAKIGQPDSEAESTDPAIQDPGLLTVYSENSLTEMTDGESGQHSYKVLFANGILDNDNGIDSIPEIVFFERGRNDVFTIELIVGGNFENPVLSDPLEINSSMFSDVGLNVNTREINGSQILGVAGYDLNDWGLSSGEAAFGFVFTGGGADLSGIFASGEVGQFVPPATVPLPAGLWLLGGALGAAGWASARKRRKHG